MAIPAQLKKLTEWLQTFRYKSGTSVLKKTEERPWLDFKDIQSVGFDNIEGLAELFNSKPADDSYLQETTSEKLKVKEALLSKVCGDWVAAMGREIRSRRRTCVRSFIHAAARAIADKENEGPLRSNTLGWAERVLGDASQGREDEST